MTLAAVAAAAPVQVMLCDDSAVARAALGRVLEADPEIRVVGRVGDGKQALDALGSLPAALKPDVILLDLEMPVMDGMTALPLLLRALPGVSVIVASALSQRGAAATMAALRAGASDYVPKPSAATGGIADPAFRAELVAKVKGWARVRRQKARPARPAPAPSPVPARPAFAAARANPAPQPFQSGAGHRPRVVAIGSSTGGPQALAALIRRIERPLPVPLLIAQHMPAGFTAMLAEHLGRMGQMPSAEAKDGELLKPGHIYVAPGDRHLVVEASQAGLVGRLSDAPPENFCRPSVDPLLRSLAQVCKGRLLVAILTGMGQDGLLGCRAVSAAGGQVIVQDEASSVVWGMPGAVARAGLAQLQAPPEELGTRIMAAAGIA